jgi:CubicO group peptidase (beta-lactamase class C family)
MKKVISAIMAFTMLFSLASCSQSSKYSLSNIKLTDSERSWVSPEEKYSELVAKYSKQTCEGAMVVATDTDIVYLYGENKTEKDGKTLVSQDTVFDIASASKTFTAVAILQLAEKGKINLNDTLDKYFPEYETGKKITINNLLHMDSGISDYMNNPDPFWNISGEDAANQKISDILMDRTTDEELLQAMYKAPLEFEPGSKFGYSNTNYRLLAFIIEQQTGMKYCDYVKKNIFDKCGMKKTTSMATGDMTYVPVNFDELVYYGFTDENGYPVCPNNTRGDGGIHSCLTDMVAFDRALFSGKLLNKDSMELLLQEENGYCCGLIKDKTGYNHSGSSLTCSANNKIIESEEFGHVYVIRLEHGKEQSGDGSGADRMTGTGYTKGTVNNGVYTNEYAGLSMTVPEEFEFFSDAELNSFADYYLGLSTEEKDKAREGARVYDLFGYDGSGSTVMISFVNTELASPDDPDYSEEDYLADYVNFMTCMGIEDDDGWVLIIRDTGKVTLSGQEYLRMEVDNDYQGKTKIFYYARKIDENLMCVVQLTLTPGKSPEEFEKLFI